MSVARSLPPLAHALHQVVVRCFFTEEPKSKTNLSTLETGPRGNTTGIPYPDVLTLSNVFFVFLFPRRSCSILHRTA